MSGMTSFLQKALLDAFLNIAPYSMPTAVFLSLHTASPTDAGSHANEVSTSGTGYARQTLATKMNATDATNGFSQNTATITAGPATADWGTVSFVAIEDAATAGNMCIWGAPTTAKAVPTGDVFQLVPSQLAIQFD
jgi:hypothetical protein